MVLSCKVRLLGAKHPISQQKKWGKLRVSDYSDDSCLKRLSACKLEAAPPAKEMSRINELEGQIRELINEPRKRFAISQDDTDWYRLCSSLDVIGDTEIAFHAYDHMPDSARPGSSYILVYGFLQALFLQQDAVRNLHEALQIPYESDQLLQEIRKVRNAVTHPTDGGLQNEKRFRFISRFSLNKSRFELMTAVPGKAPREFQEVRLEQLLDRQHTQLEHALKALLVALREEEMEHKERYRDEPLAEVFPPALDYYFEKIYQSVRDDSSWQYGAVHIELIREILDRFQTALEERQLAGVYDSVDYKVAQLAYPLHELTQFFREKGTGRLNSDDAEIFAAFVQNGISELRQMARGIDEEYSATIESDPD